MPRNRVGGPGSYNAICDVCGLKYKAQDLLKRWDGAMVCKWDWEPRHPQEFIKATPDNAPLPFVRPDSDGIDVGPTYACSTFEFITVPVNALNAELSALASMTGQATYTINKTRTYGGTMIVPDTVTVLVNCELIIGD